VGAPWGIGGGGVTTLSRFKRENIFEGGRFKDWRSSIDGSWGTGKKTWGGHNYLPRPSARAQEDRDRFKGWGTVLIDPFIAWGGET